MKDTDKQIQIIDKMLKESSLNEKTKKALEKKKTILLNDKEVLK